MTNVMNASAIMTVDGLGEVEYSISPLNSTSGVSTTMWTVDMKHAESGISIIKSLQGSQYAVLNEVLDDLRQRVLTS
jgi:hypothetical protein